MFGYFWIIVLIIFLGIAENSRETYFLFITFVFPYFFLVEIYPATFAGLEKLFLIIFLFLLNLIGLYFLAPKIQQKGNDKGV